MRYTTGVSLSAEEGRNISSLDIVPYDPTLSRGLAVVEDIASKIVCASLRPNVPLPREVFAPLNEPLGGGSGGVSREMEHLIDSDRAKEGDYLSIGGGALAAVAGLAVYLRSVSADERRSAQVCHGLYVDIPGAHDHISQALQWSGPAETMRAEWDTVQGVSELRFSAGMVDGSQVVTNVLAEENTGGTRLEITAGSVGSVLASPPLPLPDMPAAFGRMFALMANPQATSFA